MPNIAEIALSGLQAFGLRLANNADNVANMSTPGYKGGRVLLDPRPGGGVAATYSRTDRPGPATYGPEAGRAEAGPASNVELSRELPEMAMNARGYQANLRTLAADEAMGEALLDIKA